MITSQTGSLDCHTVEKTSDMNNSILSFYEKIPKIELHAHLNGSISNACYTKLLNLYPEKEKLMHKIDGRETIDSVFQIFSNIHKLMDNAEAIGIATADVISEFAAENVIYLELRSTPKEIIETGLTKKSYIETILKAIKEHPLSDKILVKYLPSVDRGRSLSTAYETIKLAEEFAASSDIIAGIDFSGNPCTENGCDFVPVLTYAKKAGLKIAAHISEIKNREDETKQFLGLEPDRIGHGTFINDYPDLTDIVVSRKIPIEICISSNYSTATSPISYEDHHISFWHDKSHPIAVCTDDKGVFNTTLSKEYEIVKRALCLSDRQTLDLSKNAINYAFVDKDTREQLINRWENITKKNNLK